jgi:hypothetical protein
MTRIVGRVFVKAQPIECSGALSGEGCPAAAEWPG